MLDIYMKSIFRVFRYCCIFSPDCAGSKDGHLEEAVEVLHDRWGRGRGGEAELGGERPLLLVGVVYPNPPLGADMLSMYNNVWIQY